MNAIKSASLFVAFMGQLLSGQDAYAHTFGAVLPSAPDAYVKYSVTCYNANDGNGDTAKYAFQIKGLTSSVPYRVQLTMQKKLDSGEVVQSDPVVDPVNGDAGYSNWGELYGGNGAYIWTISKLPTSPGGSTKGSMVFSVEHHCQSAGGAHTGTDDPVKLTSSPVDPPIDPPVDPPVDPSDPTPPGKTAKFSGALGKLATERRFAVTCSPKKGQDTSRYWFSVRGVGKNLPFQLELAVSKDGQEQLVSDLDTQDKAFGEWGYIDGGDGPYELVVRKLSETGQTQGKINYKVKHACVTDQGVRTRTSKAKKLR